MLVIGLLSGMKVPYLLHCNTKKGGMIDNYMEVAVE